MTEPILAGEALGKRFGAREVLRSASLWAHPGRITALLGRNGSGKTTLMRICAGRVRADHGTVRYRGELLTRPRLHTLARRGLLYLRQGGTITPHLKVRTHLRAMREAWPAIGREDSVEEIADRLALTDDVLNRFAGSLSGGETKRVGVALALLRRPACLLFDEPFAGIAPLDQELVTDELRRLAREGCAVALSGHDVATVLHASDEVVWMTACTTVPLGSPEEARAHAQFGREYLGQA